PDRNDDQCDDRSIQAGEDRDSVYRSSDQWGAELRGGGRWRAGAGWGERGDIYWRRWSDARLSQSPRVDGGEKSGRSVQRRGWSPHLPDRRSGAVAAGWNDRVPGTERSAGEDPRVPDRAGRDRGQTEQPSGGERSSGGSSRKRIGG